jgi:spermidine synthase
MERTNRPETPDHQKSSVPATVRWTYGLGISAISFSVLMLQIMLMKVSSFLFWHHFAYAIIALALLGMGASGSILTSRLGKKAPSSGLIACSALLYAISIPLSYMVATRIGFQPLDVMTGIREHFNMLMIYSALALPFFFAGLTLAAAIRRYAAVANRLYAFDLAGAGLGCFLIFLLMRPLGATGIILLCALCAATGSFLMGRIGRTWSVIRWVTTVILVAVFMISMVHEGDLWELTPSNAKDMQQISVPMTIEYTEWDPIARIDVSAPLTLNRGPAFSGVVSDVWRNVRIEERAIFQDAAAGTPYYRFNGNYNEEMPFMKGTLSGAPYTFLQKPRVLVIGAGGCPDCHAALVNDSSEVIAVEINAGIVKALKERYRDYGGVFLDFSNFHLITAEGRSYIRSMDSKLDIIQLSGVDTFAALASGAYSLAESYLYTVEAAEDYYHALTEDGVVSINRWLFDPPRETLRLVATMEQALAGLGITDTEKYFYIIQGGGWANTMMRRRPFTEEECEMLREYAAQWQYKTVYDPYMPTDNHFNDYLRNDTAFKSKLTADYPFRIAACYDDKPFFFQWYRFSNLFGRQKHLGTGGYHITQFPIGNFLMILTLIQVTILAAIFILFPLWSLAVRKVRRKFVMGLYFACLGFGFMFIEIVLMQKLVLFLGHPSYSISVTLFAMLTFAAIGSAVSSKWKLNGKSLGAVLGILVTAILLSTLLVTFVLDMLLGQPLMIRIIATVICLAPAAFMLGTPFPSAIRMISGGPQEILIPWFWAINGFSSVLASSTAALLTIFTGFNFVIYLACILYMIAAFIGYRFFHEL